MAGESFRVLAVRPTKGCSKSILKCLKPDTTYFFYDNFEDVKDADGNWTGIKKKASTDSVPANYFSIDGNNDGPRISISAIVGKNGCGKSSCAMIVVRILYNLHLIQKQREDLLINDLHAVLFYEINDCLYRINADGVNVSAETQEPDGSWEGISITDDMVKCFYTTASDFSVYSYIPDDYARESHGSPWVCNLFHITDKYETPVSLMPTRKGDGTIDIVADRNMCKQRLLAVLCDANDDKDSRRINEKKEAFRYDTKLEKESKLVTKLIRPLLPKEEHDFFGMTSLEPWKWTSDTERSKWEVEKEFWVAFKGKWRQYESLLDIMCFEMEQYDLLNRIDHDNPLNAYLDRVPQRIEKARIENSQDAIDSINELKGIIGTRKLSCYLLQRAMFLIQICDLWESNYRHLIINDDEQTGDMFSEALTNYWEDVKRSIVGNHERLCSSHDHALLYIVYKTYSTLQKYGSPSIQGRLNDNYDMFTHESSRNIVKDNITAIESAFESLIKDNTIIDAYYTVKLRQTTNFLKYNSFDGTQEETELTDLRSQINAAKSKIATNNGEGCQESTITLLPPPIFIGDIVLREKDDEGRVSTSKFSGLSSGEQQMTLSLYSILYHLKNIDYGGNSLGGDKDYRYTNLIMEEVELYFHPEFQREFIYRIVTLLKNGGFNNIKGINIMMVTHSPFILSDIPKSNILYLEDGVIKDRDIETLGANILDMLGDSFFMESTIGALLNIKINNLLDIHGVFTAGKSWKRKFNRANKEMEFLSRNISDTYIKHCIKSMYSEMDAARNKSKCTQEKKKYKSIEDIYNQIRNLEEELEKKIHE